MGIHNFFRPNEIVVLDFNMNHYMKDSTISGRLITNPIKKISIPTEMLMECHFTIAKLTKLTSVVRADLGGWRFLIKARYLSHVPQLAAPP